MFGPMPGAVRAVQALCLALLLGMFSGLPGAVAADTGRDLLPNGPAVGQAIPHDLSAIDQNGTPTDFSELKGGRGLVLLFTRSLDW